MIKKNFSKAAQTTFFVDQVLKAPKAFRLHIAWGVWDPLAGIGTNGNPGGEWNNVTEHCLMAMTRGEVLAELLQFSADLKQQLLNALALHDISKPQEVAHTKKAGGRITWEEYDEVLKNVDTQLKKSGFDDRTIGLSGAMGHPSLVKTEALLQKTNFTSYDLAYLVAHYCDDISVKSDWCLPIETVNSKNINQLDRRMQRNINNKNITQLGEDGKLRLNGRNTFVAQRQIGHAVEATLTAELKKHGTLLKSPLELPTFIDDKVKAKIVAL